MNTLAPPSEIVRAGLYLTNSEPYQVMKYGPIVAAGACIAFGLSTRRFAGGLLALLGGALLLRGISTANRPRTSKQVPGVNENILISRVTALTNRDAIDEASWESFPASDAPTWSRSSALPGTHK